jgi:hypothetical protein
MKGLYVNDDLERIWKEAVVAWFKVLYRHSSEGTDEGHEIYVRIAGLRAKIWTRDFPNTKQDC